MPELSFELTGDCEQDDCISNYYYYPVKLIISSKEGLIQEIDFNQEDFGPCGLDDFGFDYGDFKFDGYSGFRILHTSLGQNPDYCFWMWNQNQRCFVEYPDLENIYGDITFDYNKKEIFVVGRSGGDHHEFDTYKYINNKLTLVEKIIDQDTDGYRRVYKLINGKLKLVETSESQLKG